MVVGRVCICIRCALECNTAEAIAVVQGSCFCLSSLPTSTAATASSCHTSCSADAAQLCGGTDGAGAAAFASVYRTPATLSTEPGSSVLPCLSQRGAAATPQLYSVSPLIAPFNSTLTLVGTNLTGLASGSGSGRAVPTVNVCGGRTCEVTAYNATHVQCRMPMCSAAANESTLLHVPPHGYAKPHGDTAVRAVLSVTAAVLTSGDAAQGSAAGGVMLQVARAPGGDRRDRGPRMMLDGGPDVYIK